MRKSKTNGSHIAMSSVTGCLFRHSHIGRMCGTCWHTELASQPKRARMHVNKFKARTSGLIGGSEPNTALAMVITPGFWLPNPAKAKAGVFPILNWK
ncbi:hypothetical protein F8388_002734 [Cannabis sativa]|uniref:Uncharacterized protein n=1 Tax=Cannabis sativa TaxID=3483 RepID=A0A7J6F574_CANSA|nr:hypothetical protein F8388_002734 [Cannabis sativa]